MPANRLANETSPYLLQHAANPVDWHPWAQEALEKARRENKPILLSIGYSACHWCHVMAHESFEDPQTAQLMNARYVNIKVDREERPDLDRIYQLAHQLLTRRPGGWPLTMFLTPDQIPFFGGTYFPKEPRHGLPAFRDILQQVADFLADHPDQIHEQNSSLQQALSRLQTGTGAPGQLDEEPLAHARKALEQRYDSHNGGFGGAPKFPQSANLGFLLRLARENGDEQAREMVLDSLEAMARGGLFDQLGGGFFRYSVDERWAIPHFEKMLYDNGPLLELYARAWQVSGDALFRDVAERTGEWVMREMQSPEGGYYATLDADTQGQEGLFYLWKPEEMAEIFQGEQLDLALGAFELDRPANFEGRWHLQHHRTHEQLAALTDIPEARIPDMLGDIRKRLFRVRAERVRPGRDEKVLTAWNALMIKAMATAGRVLGRPDFIDSAGRALDFIRTRLTREGRLLAAYKDGRAHLDGYLDDHAFLVDAVLALQSARWRDGELPFAMHLAELLLEHFEDEARGGFYFTADDHEQLIHRPKPFMDESYPSGNGIAAFALNRLGHLTGDLNLVDAAEKTLRAGWDDLREYPAAHGTLLTAAAEQLTPPEVVVIRGGQEAASEWLAAAQTPWVPGRVAIAIPEEATELPGTLADEAPKPGRVTAYLCTARGCSPPVTELETFRRELGAHS